MTGCQEKRKEWEGEKCNRTSVKIVQMLEPRDETLYTSRPWYFRWAESFNLKLTSVCGLKLLKNTRGTRC